MIVEYRLSIWCVSLLTIRDYLGREGVL
jgi:hypothetical protein